MNQSMAGGATASATASRQVPPPGRGVTVGVIPKLVVTGAVVALAVGFVIRYVFRYYLNYNESAFTDPVRGAPNFWAMRGWLLMHMSGSMVALLSGPWQFWTGFRKRYARLHRWTGRSFLGGIVIGSIGGFRMALGTSLGWTGATSFIALNVAWVATAAVAYYAIRSGYVEFHKEWMARAYIVTFAFVTFRLFNDYGPTSQLQPDSERIITIVWLSWVVPLLVADVVFQLRKMRLPGAAARAKS